MSNLANAISSLLTAAAGNTALQTAIGNVAGSLTTNSQTIGQAKNYVSAFATALNNAKAAPDPATKAVWQSQAANAISGLGGLSASALPKGASAYIAALKDPVIQADPVSVANDVAQLNALLDAALSAGTLSAMLGAA